MLESWSSSSGTPPSSSWLMHPVVVCFLEVQISHHRAVRMGLMILFLVLSSFYFAFLYTVVKAEEGVTIFHVAIIVGAKWVLL